MIATRSSKTRGSLDGSSIQNSAEVNCYARMAVEMTMEAVATSFVVGQVASLPETRAGLASLPGSVGLSLALAFAEAMPFSRHS